MREIPLNSQEKSSQELIHWVPKRGINNKYICIYSQTVRLQTFNTTEHALGEGGGGDATGPHILSAEHMADGRSSVWHKTL